MPQPLADVEAVEAAAVVDHQAPLGRGAQHQPQPGQDPEGEEAGIVLVALWRGQASWGQPRSPQHGAGSCLGSCDPIGVGGSLPSPSGSRGRSPRRRAGGAGPPSTACPDSTPPQRLRGGGLRRCRAQPPVPCARAALGKPRTQPSSPCPGHTRGQGGMCHLGRCVGEAKGACSRAGRAERLLEQAGAARSRTGAPPTCWGRSVPSPPHGCWGPPQLPPRDQRPPPGGCRCPCPASPLGCCTSKGKCTLSCRHCTSFCSERKGLKPQRMKGPLSMAGAAGWGGGQGSQLEPQGGGRRGNGAAVPPPAPAPSPSLRWLVPEGATDRKGAAAMATGSGRF